MMPLKQLPCIEVGDQLIPQSMAHLQYVSRLANIVPQDPLEAAISDAVCSSCVDITNMLGPWRKAPPETKQEVRKMEQVGQK